MLPPSGLVSRMQLEDLLRLMRDSNFSIAGCEQQHASLTLTNRVHPGLEAKTLRLRAYFHQVRHIFQPEEQLLRQDKLERSLEAQLRRRGHGPSARNIFYAQAMEDFSRQLGVGGALVVGGGRWQLGVLARSAQRFDDLPQAEKTRFAKLETIAREKHAREVEESIRHCRDALRLHADRQEQELHAHGVPTSTGSCRLTEDDLLQLGEMLGSQEFSPSSDAELRSAPLVGPKGDDAVAFDDYHVPEPLVPNFPDWIREVCRLRDVFGDGVVFQSRKAECAGLAWMFLFGLQNPMQASWLQIRPLARVAPAGLHRGEGLAGIAHFKHEWSIEALAFSNDHDMAFLGDASDIQVCREVTRMGDWRCVSDEDMEDLLAVLDDERDVLGQPAAAHGQHAPKRATAEETRRRESHMAELLRLHPFLAARYSETPAPGEEDKDPHHSEKIGKVAVRAKGPTGSKVVKEVLLLDDEEVDKTWRDLHDKRAEWDMWGATGSDGPFYAEIRGGLDLKKRTSKASDCMRVVARGGQPEKFTQDFHLGETHSFAFGRYPEDNCARLVQETIRRLEYWYEWFQEVGASKAAFAAAAPWGECPPSLEFTNWLLESVDPDSWTWRRAHEVLALRPRLE